MTGMRYLGHCVLTFLLFTAAGPLHSEESAPSAASASPDAQMQQPHKLALVIHGGAGTIDRSEMTPDAEKQYRAGLETALKAGYGILQRGGSSLDAGEAGRPYPGGGPP